MVARVQDTDVLVIGAGAAGLVAALSAAPRRVAILSASDDGYGAATRLAQGGIAAAVGSNDSPQQHALDTLRAGHPENSVAAVDVLCHEAAAGIAYLSEHGVAFDRSAHAWCLHREAAHTQPRVLHANGDGTGACILAALQARCREAEHIDFLPPATAVRLLTGDDAIVGAQASDGAQLFSVRARDTVLATGGLGGLFWKTTNPLTSCGDGVAMALQAGAQCEHLEFVQFHPTALDIDADPLPLVTEALRGAGAYLVNDRDERFMRACHPLVDLAPRDVVARAIWRQNTLGRKVLLRIPADVAAALPVKFPALHALCARYRIDVAASGIPITPAAHYHMGGVAVDLLGRTSLPGLWAVGEVACNRVHGANRLASNSLLEAVVFGRRLGHALAERCRGGRAAGMARASAGEQLLTPPDHAIWTALRLAMWQHMGIVREPSGMQTALVTIRRCRALCKLEQSQLYGRLNLAEHMLLSALQRQISCGAHCVA